MADITGALAIAAPFTASQESFQALPYYDVNGYAIGYGNHYYSDGTAVDAGDPAISQSDAPYLMVFYLTQGGNTILSQITVPLANNQLAALMDAKYNEGSLGSDLVNLINGGADPATIAAALLQTDVATNRAQAESNLYLNTSIASAAGILPGVSNTALIGVGAAALAIGLLIALKD